MAFAATEGGDRDYALGHDTPRPAATEAGDRDYALGHDTPRPAATEGEVCDYALGHDTPRPAAAEDEVRDYALGHDTPRAGHDVHEPELRHETTTRPRLATSPTNPFDTEAWQHIEALRALLQRVSDTETATLAAALSRLQVIYSSRATEAKEGTGCRATCRRRTAQLGARVVQCAAPALRWLAGDPDPSPQPYPSSSPAQGRRPP